MHVLCFRMLGVGAAFAKRHAALQLQYRPAAWADLSESEDEEIDVEEQSQTGEEPEVEKMEEGVSLKEEAEEAKEEQHKDDDGHAIVESTLDLRLWMARAFDKEPTM